MHQVMAEVVEPLVELLVTRKERPLGLFLTMDILAPCVYAERPYLNTLHPQPAVIDVRAAEIGRRAVLQLLQRKQFPNETPVGVLVQPQLVEP